MKRVMPVNPSPTAGAGHSAVNEWRPLTVALVEQESDLVTSFWLASPDGDALPAPVAGQYLPISVDVPGHGLLRRTYTVSAYDGGRYRLTIKRDSGPGRPAGRVSNHIHDTWAVGDQLSAGMPQGHFILDKTSGRPIVLLAGGIGITPLLAMLRELATCDATRNIVLIWAVRHQYDHPFRGEIANLKRRMPDLTVHVRYSERPTDGDGGQAPDSYGFVDVTLLRGLVHSSDVDAYLCGPPPFMQAMVQGLAAIGVRDEHIRSEAFGPATIDSHRGLAATPKSSVGAVVTFAKSDITAPFDPRALNLLEFAEDLGLNPSFNCRSGTCGSCATRKLSGAVRYATMPTARVADHEILLCCALPDGPISLEL